jgi:DNA primase
VGRIPDEDIERLKEEVSLERLVTAAGVELARHGADLVGLCPFHDDHQPSLVVSPKKNLWHCLGACSTGGSVIDWVMRREGVSFRHAVELLRDGSTSSGPISGPAPQRSTVRKLPSPVDRSAADAELLAQVAAYYGRTLCESPEALAYLAARRIDHPEAISTFQLGYANRTLCYRLPERNRRQGAELRGRLQSLGILRPSGHEHLAGSLVVPLKDAMRRVTDLYGRKIRDDLRPGTPAHLYLPGPHAGMFNPDAIEASEEVVLCESLVDALTLWCCGFRHVTASYGTEGFTEELRDALTGHSVRRVLLAFDRDEAGDRAARRVGAVLMAGGIECFRVEWPAGADVNDVARQAKSPTDALSRHLRKAAWMGSGPAPAGRRHTAPVTAAAPAAPVSEAPASEEAPAPSFAAAPPPAIEVGSVSPLPAAALPVPVTSGPGEATITIGERRWRVRGLDKITSFDLLRLNVLVSRTDERQGALFHVDTLDLYSARARAVFTKSAAEEIGASEEVVKRDLGKVLLCCEALADQAIAAAQAPQAVTVELTAEERTAALELLRAPDLPDRIVCDFARAGIVGEETNCLLGYLAAVSRKLERPLAVIVQSTSAAGKSALMEAVLQMVPAEERVKFSAMTGQSLFYMGEADLCGKVLGIAEEEGAERASYALKLLQSEGELSIASTGKDNASGRLVTHTYKVSGPVAIMLTTTAIDVDEELLNRCVVLSVDEERAQTRAIHDRQRHAQTLDGLIAARERDRVTKLHQDAQRLLEPLAVVNPFAASLRFPDSRTRTRRDHVKYLTLINAIALLHQHQRPRRRASGPGGEPVSYIEVTAADVALANRLAGEVLGTSLDELPPGTRRRLELLDHIVAGQAEQRCVGRCDVLMTRRQLREATGLGDTQLKVHLARLVDLELVAAHRADKGGNFVYELCWDGAGGDGGRFLAGLCDPERLVPHGYDDDRSGTDGDRSGSGRGPVGGWSAPGRGGETAGKPVPEKAFAGSEGRDTPENTVPGHANGTVVVQATGRRAG